MVGLEGHYKSQGLNVPVRSVSPFSDPSSNLAQPSRSGAIRLATGQHGPDDPSVLVGDRDRRAVIAAPLAKLVDPHTSRVGFSHCRADNCARTMYEKCPQVLIATLCDTHHHFAIATRMLAWYQAQPGCQVAAVLEVGAPSPIAAIIAVAVFGPIPRILAILWQTSLALKIAVILRSKALIRSSICNMNAYRLETISRSNSVSSSLGAARIFGINRRARVADTAMAIRGRAGARASG